MRIQNNVREFTTRQSKFKSNVKIKINTKINKQELMKAIRDHCTALHIKDSYSNYDLKKHHSSFNFPTVECTSHKSSKIIGNYFNKKRYFTDSKNAFIRNSAIHFVSKVNDTSRTTLLNYPAFKYFEKVGKDNPNLRYLCEVLVSEHLATTIAARRAGWINIFFTPFTKLETFQNALLQKLHYWKMMKINLKLYLELNVTNEAQNLTFHLRHLFLVCNMIIQVLKITQIKTQIMKKFG